MLPRKTSFLMRVVVQTVAWMKIENKILTAMMEETRRSRRNQKRKRRRKNSKLTHQRFKQNLPLLPSKERKSSKTRKKRSNSSSLKLRPIPCSALKLRLPSRARAGK
jgi:hypothetical protein